MNYGEDLAYWYLRLNGFFPISNFVVHRSSGVPHTSDVDVLAVRPPHVFEEIGGQPHDWDDYLASGMGFGRHIGVVCEVKTGSFDEARLFRPEHLRYTIRRIGLADPVNIEQLAERLANEPLVEVAGGAAIAKLFISSTENAGGRHFHRTLAQIEDFLVERVRRYSVEKYASRMFFPSNTFQLIIARVHREIERRDAA